jgi:hypothetical protein
MVREMRKPSLFDQSELPLFLLTFKMKMIIIFVGYDFHYHLEGDQENADEKKKYSMDHHGGAYSRIHSCLRKREK